jgi:hypothetical protein
VRGISRIQGRQATRVEEREVEEKLSTSNARFGRRSTQRPEAAILMIKDKKENV